MRLNSSMPVRAMLLGGCAVMALGAGALPAVAASMVDRSLDRRIVDLEAEVRLLKNRVKALEDRKLDVPDKLVVSGNSRVKVTLYGQINRAVVFGFSRRNTEIHHVDNDTSESRIGVFARARLTEDTIITAVTEVRWLNNFRSGTDDSNVGNAIVDASIVDIGIRNGRFGSLFLGYGYNAADGADYQDLSGTSLVFDATGCGNDGLRFDAPNATGASGVRLSAICGTFDGIRENRVMYVSPLFRGFTFKVSHGDNDRFALGAYYYGSPFGLGDFTVAAGFGWTYLPTGGTTTPMQFAQRGGISFNSWSGSLSVLHKPTGLSLTGAGGYKNRVDTIPGKRAAHYFYVKAGWQTMLLPYGKTYFSVDYGQYEHIRNFNDFAWVTGAAVVQAVDEAALDLYAGIHYQDARVAGVGFDGLVTAIIGARIKF